MSSLPVTPAAAVRPERIPRSAPDQPADVAPAPIGVRLTHIEEISDRSTITLPVSLSREIRIAEEQQAVTTPSDTKAAEPGWRAALNLGDQPIRSQHR